MTFKEFFGDKRINFYGFTNENTVGDIRDFFNGADDDEYEKVVQKIKLCTTEYFPNDRRLPEYFKCAIIDIVFESILDENAYTKLSDSYGDLNSIITTGKSKIGDDIAPRDNVAPDTKLIDLFDENAVKVKRFYTQKVWGHKDEQGGCYNDIKTILTYKSFFSDNSINFAAEKIIARNRIVLTARPFIKDLVDYKIKYLSAFGFKDFESDYPDDNFDDEKFKFINDRLGDHKQIIFHGAPGTGKTNFVTNYVKKCVVKNDGAYDFIQFHSSYDYTDFIEGLRPAVVGFNDDDSPIQSFVRMEGSFKRFCRKVAVSNKLRKAENLELLTYYFIIDEVNRADLSRVFGEIMYSLEESYRGENHPIKTQYHNLPVYEYEGEVARPIDDTVFANGFYIPENVIIIGTMNDIDRSVESFDFALRRRFHWENIKAADTMKYIVEKYDDYQNNIDALNDAIVDEGKRDFNLTDDYQLGGSYFKKLKGLEKGADLKKYLGEYFDKELKLILTEYVRGRNPERVEEFIKKCRAAFKGEAQ